MTDRLTIRKGRKVYINTGVIPRSECSGEYGVRFCTESEYCSQITNRKCPVLQIFDKLADYEDREEAENALKERLSE